MMKRRCWKAMAAVFALATACGGAFAQDAADGQTLAITAFFVPTSVLQSMNGRVPGLTTALLGEALADHLTTQVLARNAQIKLLERREIQRALEEMKLDESALFEGDGSSRLGHFLRANYIVIGTVSAMDVREIPRSRWTPGDILSNGKPQEVVVQISARLIDVAQNRVLMSKSYSGSKRLAQGFDQVLQQGRGPAASLEHILAAAESAAREMAEWIIPSPVCSAEWLSLGKDVMIEMGAQHGMKVGQKLNLYVVKSRKKKDGVEIFVDRELIGTIEIVDVQPMSSRARLTTPLTTKIREHAELQAIDLSGNARFGG